MTVDLDTLRRAKGHVARQYREQTSGGEGGGFESAGPPHWNRQAWEQFKAAHGHYPYGFQSGPHGTGFVAPPTMAGAPDWVYDLLGQRKPPIGFKDPGMIDL